MYVSGVSMASECAIKSAVNPTLVVSGPRLLVLRFVVIMKLLVLLSLATIGCGKLRFQLHVDALYTWWVTATSRGTKFLKVSLVKSLNIVHT